MTVVRYDHTPHYNCLLKLFTPEDFWQQQIDCKPLHARRSQFFMQLKQLSNVNLIFVMILVMNALLIL